MFRLRKWYMDCVAPDGTAVVAYWARLTWGVLRLRYGATMAHRNGCVRELATLWPSKEPYWETGRLAWRCARLDIKAQWDAIDAPLRRTLLASHSGNVDWICVAPRARARVSLADSVALEGLGYVERLDMTLPPWRLPIRELRWGRFLSERASVVWIEWRGLQPLALLAVNGVDQCAVNVSDARVAWRGGCLELDTGSVLRDGTLGTTVLGRFPLLRLFVPPAVREMQEYKRLRRARLIGNGQVESGWALDEVVRFGGDHT